MTTRPDGGLDWTEMSVLVTGGTGSFGRKFVEIMLQKYHPRRLVVFSRDELKQSEMAARFDHPSLRFFIGDVRDRERLERAMHGIDIVVHAAALKQIPACEYNPFEAIQTNVIGGKNVIDAAIDQGVKRVLAISTDKACVDWRSPVRLADGKTLPISAIVRGQERLSVATLDGEELTQSKIAGWYKNRRAGRRMLRLSYQGAPGNGGHKTGVWLTDDHQVLTVSGWKKARDLAEGEFLITAEAAVNPRQFSLLVGTLLGDSGLVRTRKIGSRWDLRMGHAAKEAEWLNLKLSALNGLPFSLIKTEPSRGGRQPFLTVRSATMASLTSIAEKFYDSDGRKSVPQKLVEHAFSRDAAVFLASWFLDDGCHASPNRAGLGLARLATHGFRRSEVYWLAGFLSSHGLDCRAVAATVDGRQYWELRFSAAGSRHLFDMIAPGVPPTMRHKVSRDARPYDPSFWELGSAVRFRAPALFLPGKPPRPRDVYCIGVEGTENFIVNGLVLHNCQPINLYGATKLCAEKLFVQANVYGHPRGTVFGVLRYGNVIGSRGSVIPLFASQRESGTVTVTDRRMTRFWIKLEQGVEFAIRCVALTSGGEIFIPKIPSMRMMDLVEAVAPNCQVKVIGIRPGEKLHEILMSDDESRQAVEFGDMFVIEPIDPAWNVPERAGGKRPAEGFRYSSETNDRWFSKDEMRGMANG